MNLSDSINKNAKLNPEKVAIIDTYAKYVPMNFSCTYRELNEQANRLSNGLLALGLEKGDRIAIQTDSRAPYLLWLLGAAKAGLVLVPINSAFLQDEVIYQIEDSGAKAFVVDDDILRKRIPNIRSRLGKNSVKYVIGLGEGHDCPYDYEILVRENPADEPKVKIEDGDILTIVYTSGSTGLPKGVPQTHRRWTTVAYLWSAEWRMDRNTRLQVLPPMHTSGGNGMSVAILTLGGTLILSGVAPERILQVIQEQKPNYTMFTPTLLAMTLRGPNIGKYDLSSIKRWFTSGAPISAELLKEGAKHFGEHFIQPFGTTETALLGCCLREDEREIDGTLSRRLTSVGKAGLGYEVKVVDDEGKEVPPGEIGELVIRGEGVAEGYWNKPDAPDFKEGWWYSGDLAKIDEDGYIFIVDRKKDMIISGAYNVYPREIEEVISTHPGVHLVAVIGVPDDKWGEAVKAVIVPKQGVKITEEEIIEYCRARLAPYKKPKSVELSTIDELPMISGGFKLLKRELRDRYRKEYERTKGKKVESWGAV